jgi:hypothetical protein
VVRKARRLSTVAPAVPVGVDELTLAKVPAKLGAGVRHQGGKGARL